MYLANIYIFIYIYIYWCNTSFNTYKKTNRAARETSHTHPYIYIYLYKYLANILYTLQINEYRKKCAAREPPTNIYIYICIMYMYMLLTNIYMIYIYIYIDIDVIHPLPARITVRGAACPDSFCQTVPSRCSQLKRHCEITVRGAACPDSFSLYIYSHIFP